MMTMKKTGMVIACALLAMQAFSQQLRLGKNPLQLQKSAILELESDNQGMLFPRITDTALINSLIPPDGMVIYHLPSRQLMVRSNGYWQPQITGTALNSYWNVNGNTTGAYRTLGSTDNFALGFITSNTERMRILANGNTGIGTATPNNLLEVAGTNAATGVSGLRLTGLGAATPGAVSNKLLTVDANGDVVVASNPAATNWSFTGNAGINPATNFLGTTDDQPLILKSFGSPYVELGRRQTLGLVQGYPDYTDGTEQLLHLKGAVQFFAPAAAFYKPKIYVDANGNFRTKGSSAGTDFFEFGATGASNDGGFEFIIGDDGDEPIVFKSYHYVNGMSEMMRLQSGRMAVGSNAFDATNPEKLLIDAGVTSSYNLMTGKGSINNYLQLNIQNRSNGNTASSDIVATADNGTESVNYVNMGINSSGFTNTTYPMIGGINNAYLYSTGNDFVIGNGTASRHLRFFTGGFANSNERMRIDGSGNVSIGTTTADAKLDVSGTVILGENGTPVKNMINFEVTLGSNIAVPGASLNILLSTFSPGVLEQTFTIPAASLPTSTRGTVVVSADRDLPASTSIASARVSSGTQVRVRFLNNGTSSQTLSSGTKFYIKVTEF